MKKSFFSSSVLCSPLYDQICLYNEEEAADGWNVIKDINHKNVLSTNWIGNDCRSSNSHIYVRQR